jgi:hypothetical protein
MVVLTQNNRCRIIPKMNKTIDVFINEILKKKEIIYAPTSVMITSTIARPINL